MFCATRSLRRNEESHNQETSKKFMILFSRSVTTNRVSVMNEYKDSRNNVQSSPGAHWRTSLNVHNCVALRQNHRKSITGRFGQSVMPVTCEGKDGSVRCFSHHQGKWQEWRNVVLSNKVKVASFGDASSMTQLRLLNAAAYSRYSAFPAPLARSTAPPAALRPRPHWWPPICRREDEHERVTNHEVVEKASAWLPR